MSAFRKPRLTCPHCGSVFVIEKPGDAASAETAEGAPPAEETAPKMLALRTQEWFEVFWAYHLAGSFDQCRKMIRLAKATDFWRFDPVDAPGLDAVQAMRKIDITTEAWSAWRKYLAGQDLRLDQNMLPAWVWVPSEWPQEDVKTARTG